MARGIHVGGIFTQGFRLQNSCSNSHVRLHISVSYSESEEKIVFDVTSNAGTNYVERTCFFVRGSQQQWLSSPSSLVLVTSSGVFCVFSRYSWLEFIQPFHLLAYKKGRQFPRSLPYQCGLLQFLHDEKDMRR